MEKLPVSTKGDNISDIRLDDTVTVLSRRVFCDGGGLSGHPGVWYDISAREGRVCQYCGRKFVFDEAVLARASGQQHLA